MGTAGVTAAMYSEGNSAIETAYGICPRRYSDRKLNYRKRWSGVFRTAITTTATTDDVFFIGHVHASLTTVNNIYLNGGSEGTEGTGNIQNGYDLARIGAQASLTPLAFWAGDIAEVLVYQSALSAEDVATTLAYLAARYGITLA
jgi:hypothetical protein